MLRIQISKESSIMAIIEAVLGIIGGIVGLALGLVGAVVGLVMGGIGLVVGLFVVGFVLLVVVAPLVLVFGIGLWYLSLVDNFMGSTRASKVNRNVYPFNPKVDF
jgi:hypothetical protein